MCSKFPSLASKQISKRNPTLLIAVRSCPRLYCYRGPPHQPTWLVRYIWESNADGQFAISEDTEGEPLGRGTQINIYLKEDAVEYAEEDKLKVCEDEAIFL